MKTFQLRPAVKPVHLPCPLESTVRQVWWP